MKYRDQLFVAALFGAFVVLLYGLLTRRSRRPVPPVIANYRASRSRW